MGRPVNEEMKAHIEEAAYGLFESVGYDKATYAAIADEAGISRTLYAVTACMLQLLQHELVNAQRFLSLVHNHAQMFIQLPPVVIVKLYYLSF